jgi:hypothetical protein
VDERAVDRSEDRQKRQKSAAEIEAVSRIADCLLDLERRDARSDRQIQFLAQAVDALELGAFEAVSPLTDEARAAPPGAPTAAPPDRAHALVQGLALDHLRRKFLRLVAGTGRPWGTS